MITQLKIISYNKDLGKEEVGSEDCKKCLKKRLT